MPYPDSVCCAIYDIRPKLILNILFVHNIRLDNTIVLKFCTEHDNVVLCAKFQNDWTIKTDVMDKRDFARLELKMFRTDIP